MPNIANIYVSFGDDDRALNVMCVIDYETPVMNFRFSLSTLLTIDSVTAGTDSEWKIIREWKPQWQHQSNEIEISAKIPTRQITIEYHGRISGWCNIIEERRIALSAYSAWCISEISVPVKLLFRIMGMEDYFVVNAKYDDSDKVWIYGETGHDTGNIIALKKGCYHVATTGDFSFYYLNEAEKAYAEACVLHYDNVMTYFSSLFG